MDLKIPPTDLQKITRLLEILQKNGHEGYLVGGCVRDLLMGKEPKDYDFAVSAKPEEVESLYKSTNPIGKAFGTIQVVLENHAYELTTFRKDFTSSNNRHPDGVVFGSMQEDALRRDFTMNALYYDPLKQEIHDFYNGQQDIQNNIIRFIGKPSERIYEDRLRVLRAFRFQAQLGFDFAEETAAALMAAAKDLHHLSWERIHREVEKTIVAPYFLHTGEDFIISGIIQHLYGEQNAPVMRALKACYAKSTSHEYLYTIFLAFHALDAAKDYRLSKTTKNCVQKIRNFFSTKQDVYSLRRDFSNDLGTTLFYFATEMGKTSLVRIFEQAFSGLPHEYELAPPLLTAKDFPHLKGKNLGDALDRAYRLQIEQEIKTKDRLLSALESPS